MKVLLCACLILPLLAAASVRSEECPPPPVTSEKQAVCLALHYFEREWPGVDWRALQSTATETDGAWLVQFIDPSPGVRGNGGELTLDAASGEVTRRVGYR